MGNMVCCWMKWTRDLQAWIPQIYVINGSLHGHTLEVEHFTCEQTKASLRSHAGSTTGLQIRRAAWFTLSMLTILKQKRRHRLPVPELQAGHGPQTVHQVGAVVMALGKDRRTWIQCSLCGPTAICPPLCINPTYALSILSQKGNRVERWIEPKQILRFERDLISSLIGKSCVQ